MYIWVNVPGFTAICQMVPTVTGGKQQMSATINAAKNSIILRYLSRLVQDLAQHRQRSQRLLKPQP